jgi:hypothetical protein
MSSIRKDLHHNLSFLPAFNVTTIGTSTTTAGTIIDTRGFHSLEFVIGLGTRTDGTFTPYIQESDNADMSTPNDVIDDDLFGLEADHTLTTTNGLTSIGVRLGNKRYVRLSIVSTGVTTGSTGVHAIAVCGTPSLAPTTAT